MSKVLVFAEFANGKVKKGALELLSAAKTGGLEAEAVVIGAGSKEVSAELGHYGAKKTYVLDSADLSNYNPESYSAAIAEAVEKSSPNYILASSSILGRDLFPKLGAKLNTGVISDCTELKVDGGNLSVRRPMYAGKCSAEVEFKNSASPIILMRPNQLPVAEADSSLSTETVELSAVSANLKTLVKEVVKGTSEKLDLTEANIIVAGGRGLKDAESFKILDGLADTLGATVGASRAVVDAGWVSHSMQVGQTGKTVAPTLYIACGISGAIQHLAGMSASRVIVAINKDAEAPIFQKATYGIVGDAFEVIPKLTEEFQKLLSE